VGIGNLSEVPVKRKKSEEWVARSHLASGFSFFEKE
jgi:hypothetical protein